MSTLEPAPVPAKKHIGSHFDIGRAFTLCGRLIETGFDGEWVSGAVYEGMMILDGDASEYCPDCAREWLRRRNRT